MRSSTAWRRANAGGSEVCAPVPPNTSLARLRPRPRKLGVDLIKKGGQAQAQAPVNAQQLGQAQQQANIGTAESQSQLNNLNTFSPYGSTVFTAGQIDPTTGMPSSYNATQQLSPQFGDLFGAQTGLARNLVGYGGGFAGYGPAMGAAGAGLIGRGANVAGGLPTALDLGNVPNISPLGVGSFRTDVTQGPGGQPLPGVVSSFGQGLPGVVRGFGTNFIPGLVGQAQNAAYGSQAQYLDPQFAHAGEQLRQQLADQGIQEGSPAYTQAIGDFARSQREAYSNAQMNAVQAGNAQEQALFGQALAGAGFSNQAQQQMFGQAATGAGFANQAQAQLFGQGMSLADLYNQAVLGAANQNLAAQSANLGRAQAEFQAPYTAASALTGLGSQIFGTGLGGVSSALPFVNAWPAGAATVPNLAPGTATGVPATNLAQATQAATNANLTGFNMGQTQLNNLIGGANLGANALFGRGLFGGGGGGAGGGGLFGNLFGGGGGAGGGGLFSVGGLLGSQGPLFGTAADLSIAAGGPPLALPALLA
jgi:hypothetical protein